MNRKYRHILSGPALSMACVLAVGITSCQTEDTVRFESGQEIRFSASVCEKEIPSRALEVKTVKNTDFDTHFYMEMEVESQGKDIGTYYVAPGTEGRLTSVSEESALNWKDPVLNHTFYSWTYPWTTDVYVPGNDPKTIISFDENDYKGYGLKEEEVNNCRVLEKFVGATAGPVNYRSNGEYVAIEYKHLVSKIRIGQLRQISSGGTINYNVYGTITFIGLPNSAIFNRRPEDGGAPVVEPNPDSFTRVTYNIMGSPPDTPVDEMTAFYVCPDIDFSTLRFAIHLENSSSHGDYYGDFSSVVFKRDEEDMEEWNEDKNPTVLYAGEVMTLSFTLTDGDAIGSMGVYIKGWDTMEKRDGIGHPRPGIYDNQAFKDFLQNFNNDYTQDQADRMYDLYGDGVDNTFYVYEDIDFSENYPGRIPVGKDYVLDGLGHTVKVKTSWPEIDPEGFYNIGKAARNEGYPDMSECVIKVGPVRDIFFADEDGHMIYVDSDGNIFLVDESGSMTPSGSPPLPPTFESPYRSFFLDLENGTWGYSYSI